VRNVILIRLGLWNKVKVIVYRCLTPSHMSDLMLQSNENGGQAAMKAL
jgi:hypothetical protein